MGETPQPFIDMSLLAYSLSSLDDLMMQHFFPSHPVNTFAGPEHHLRDGSGVYIATFL